MKIVVALTGASGVVLGRRLVEELSEHEVHVIVTAGAKAVAEHEGADLVFPSNVSVYDDCDMSSPLASSSNLVDAMAVLPCSMRSLSAIANGYASTLVTRCAENVLKLGAKLVVSPRDTPYSLAAIENMRCLKLAGAVIVPPVVAYYHGPSSVQDVTDFAVGKVLDCLGVEHSLYRRWKGSP